MQLVDIGANLSHKSFAHDFEQVVSAARAAGVAHIVLTGTDLETSEMSAQLALQSAGYFSSTAGFHPHVASSCGPDQLQSIASLGQRNEVVAIGETGLDFNRNFSAPAKQIEVFEQHLQLAASLQKPVFLHQRDAHDDFIRLLKRYRGQLAGGVVHCFTDSEAALLEYLELDMYIGVTGWICDERRGKPLQELVSKIPADRLLIETDAPYLLPRTLTPAPKSRRNEPRFLPEILQTIAHCCGRAPEQLGQETRVNAQRLFGFKIGHGAPA